MISDPRGGPNNLGTRSPRRSCKHGRRMPGIDTSKQFVPLKTRWPRCVRCSPPGARALQRRRPRFSGVDDGLGNGPRFRHAHLLSEISSRPVAFGAGLAQAIHALSCLALLIDFAASLATLCFFG